jgi:hypothetical protein
MPWDGWNRKREVTNLVQLVQSRHQKEFCLLPTRNSYDCSSIGRQTILILLKMLLFIALSAGITFQGIVPALLTQFKSKVT